MTIPNLIDIPPSRLVSCVYCAERLDSNAVGTYQRAKGWVRVKRSGTNQGVNALAMKELLHIFACSACIDKLKRGIPLGQMSLFKLGDNE